MNLLRSTLLIVGLLAFGVEADAAKPAKKNKATAKIEQIAGGAMADSSDFFTAPLIPADELAKVKLTAEQKPQFDKITKEFTARLKELSDKAKAPAPAAPAAKGKKALPKGGNPALQEVTSLRGEYETKVNEVFTDAQKEAMEAFRAKKAEALLNGTARTPAKK